LLLLPARLLGGIVPGVEQLEAHRLRAFVFNFEIARHRFRADIERMPLTWVPIGQHPGLESRTIKLRLVVHYDGGASGGRNGCKFPLRNDVGVKMWHVVHEIEFGSGQVKHHRAGRKTGRDAVDRLLAWKDSCFQLGVLVTNTEFTRDARWTAELEQNRRFLRLRDFEDLKRWIRNDFTSDQEWREIPAEIELASGVTIQVPRATLIKPQLVWPQAAGYSGEAER